MLEFNKLRDSLVFLERGHFVMDQCHMNLASVIESNQELIPAVLCNKKTHISMENCELKGTFDFNSIGIALKRASASIKTTNVSNFSKGGIIMLVDEKSNVLIEKAKVTFNLNFGIQILGNSLSPLIRDCSIENNNCVGIQICISNKSNIKNNNISTNQNGIEVICADPYITENCITKNYKGGIVLKAYDGLMCKAVISTNEIMYNHLNGIICTGRDNTPKIVNNKLIAYNKMSGIKIDDEAHAIIAKNMIYKNMLQGILIAEKCSAHIENNEIMENILANIAFGGKFLF